MLQSESRSGSFTNGTGRTKRLWLEPLALFLGCLIIYWAGNDQVTLWDRDEPRYAATARTMLETGDYIVPYFNGEFRFQKPVLTYWLVALTTAVGGDSPFFLRASAGLLVAAGCLVIYRLGNDMFGRPAGLLAGIMVASTPTIVFLGKLCIPDGPQFFFATVCFYGLYHSWQWPGREEHGEAKHGKVWFWLALAGSILTKGPIVLGMLASTMLVLRITAHAKLRDFKLQWIGGLLVLLLTAAPWFVVIHLTSGNGFFSESVGKQLGERTVVSFDGRWLPPGYYAASLLLGFIPWLAFANLSLIRNFSRWRAPGPIAFLVAWIVGPMVLLELFRSKQLHYLAPAYPAFALLAAGYLASLLRGESAWVMDRYSRYCVYGWRALGLTLAGAFVAVAVYGPRGGSVFALLAAAVVFAGTILSAAALRSGEVERAFWLQTGMLANSWWIVGALLLPAMESDRIVRTVGEAIAKHHAADGATVLTRGLFEPSMIYYSNMNIANFSDDQSLLAFLGSADGERWMPVTEQELLRLRCTLGDRLQIEETWSGWVKMHRDVVHLVRIAPSAAILAHRESAERR